MASTTNYNLYLTESGSESFMSWREKINGKEDSNMVKIDTILHKKADSSRLVSAVLLSTEWKEMGHHHEQTIPVDGLLEDTNGIINIAQDASEEVRDIVRQALLAVTDQSDGAITVTADGCVPNVDIPVSIIIVN